jgi:hypothetical protein
VAVRQVATSTVPGVSYENLWVVAFFHPAELDAKVPRVVGPFPAAEAAEDFDRQLRESWPTDEEPIVAIVQVEATDPIEDLLVHPG